MALTSNSSKEDAVGHLVPQDCQRLELVEGRPDDGMCSCGLYGLPGNDRDFNRSSEMLIRARAQRKGWSHAKTERAVRDSIDSSPPPANFDGLRRDVREIIVESLSANSTIGVFIHMYTGAIDAEQIDVVGTQTATSEQFLSDDALLVPDCLLWIRR